MKHALAICVLAALSAGCNRDQKDPRVLPSAAAPPTATRQVEIVAGGHAAPVSVKNPYEGNRWAEQEGRKLFGYYNCSGCHSGNGGGNIGPAVMDSSWIYGNDPGNIYETIVKGRPNGMPSFGGKVPEYQVWQLVTYVRSLGGVPTKPEARNQQNEPREPSK